MNDSDSTPPRHVPILTEVIDWPDATQLPAPALAPAPAPLLALNEIAAPGPATGTRPALTAPPDSVGALPSEAQIVEHVLAEVQRQIDLMLEYRLREALMPVLARVTENLIREARSELASTLRDVVARAVAQEMARHRAQ